MTADGESIKVCNYDKCPMFFDYFASAESKECKKTCESTTYREVSVEDGNYTEKNVCIEEADCETNKFRVDDNGLK